MHFFHGMHFFHEILFFHEMCFYRLCSALTCRTKHKDKDTMNCVFVLILPQNTVIVNEFHQNTWNQEYMKLLFTRHYREVFSCVFCMKIRECCARNRCFCDFCASVTVNGVNSNMHESFPSCQNLRLICYAQGMIITCPG